MKGKPRRAEGEEKKRGRREIRERKRWNWRRDVREAGRRSRLDVTSKRIKYTE